MYYLLIFLANIRSFESFRNSHFQDEAKWVQNVLLGRV